MADSDDARERGLDAVRASAERYEDAGLLGRAALRLGQRAPSAANRERLRRHDLGVEGRIAEDVTRAVVASEPIWNLLVENDIPEDATVRELAVIDEVLRGRAEGDDFTRTVISITYRWHDLRADAVRAAIPGGPHPGRAYRYATLTDLRTGRVEPFVLALADAGRGDNDVVAAMLLDATFLRHEQELGVVAESALAALEDVAGADLEETRRTYEALRGA